MESSTGYRCGIGAWQRLRRLHKNQTAQYYKTLYQNGFNDEAYQNKYRKSPYMAYMMGSRAKAATVKISPKIAGLNHDSN